MDWLKLFALLVAVASVQIKADGPKKKIRIHLPQKVKHIHHHKKIYITNHAAPSQYAPAYMPGRDGAVALPSNVPLPAVTNILPLNSVEIIDENQHRLHGISPAASKLLPLYHARGYYGPTTSELEEDYDLNPPPDPVDSYLPAAYSSPATISQNHLPKKIKIVKINDQPRKKVVRKGKHKRVVVRKRPQPPPPPIDEEVPVTNFHEQFYADLDGSGIIRKIKKPPRVEKIVDGDTEHIHAYSEEHIHKLVFDDPNKYNSVVGDPVPTMTAITQARPMNPYKNSQTLIAIPSDSFSKLAGLGPIAAPAPLEYAAFNRDVTHDHIFHDHGEIPADVDITKDALSLPPKVSYNSKGLRISGGAHKRQKSKHSQRTKKINKPHSPDFSYYESIFTPNRPKKTHTQTLPFLDETESNLDDYRTINNIRYNTDAGIVKPRNLVPTYYGKPGHEYRTQQDSAAAPFSVSSTVVHDYKPKVYATAASSVARYKDPYVNFKDNYANNYEYDTYASSSNIYTTEDKNQNLVYSLPEKKSTKKSISTQNISFGGQDHLTYVDHLEETSLSEDETPTALDFDHFDQTQLLSSPTPTPYTIKQSSPVHPYYTVMAVQAMHDQPSMPAASNNNYQYAEAPTTTTPFTPSSATTASPSPQSSPLHNNVQSTSPPAVEPIEYIAESKPNKRYREQNSNLNGAFGETSHRETYVHKDIETPIDHRVRSLQTPDQAQLVQHNPLIGRAKLKYGDKI